MITKGSFAGDACIKSSQSDLFFLTRGGKSFQTPRVNRFVIQRNVQLASETTIFTAKIVHLY